MAAIQSPEEVFGPDFDFDAGEDDGHTIPYDGGVDWDGGGGGGGEPPAEPLGVWGVIAPALPDTIDVQQLATTATYVPDMVLYDVAVPSAFGTPLLGDVGTVRKLPDGTNVFLPSCRRPRAPATTTTLGSTAEHDDVLAEEWDAEDADNATIGVELYAQTNTNYNDAADTPTLKARFYGVKTDEFGAVYHVVGESEVSIDIPEACT